MADPRVVVLCFSLHKLPIPAAIDSTAACFFASPIPTQHNTAIDQGRDRTSLLHAAWAAAGTDPGHSSTSLLCAGWATDGTDPDQPKAAARLFFHLLSPQTPTPSSPSLGPLHAPACVHTTPSARLVSRARVHRPPTTPATVTATNLDSDAGVIPGAKP
jgi:hypothetical protein